MCGASARVSELAECVSEGELVCERECRRLA